MQCIVSSWVEDMVRREALRRTFHLKYGDSSGTCFAIDVNNRQFLITAAHVLTENTEAGAIPEIWHDNEWKVVRHSVIKTGSNGIDVAVIAVTDVIADPRLVVYPTSQIAFLSQEVFFLGFPYGMRCNVGVINEDFPIPLVKKGCISKIADRADEFILIDGHNNPGFSGGPIIYNSGAKTCIAGVVVGRTWRSETPNQDGAPVKVWSDDGLVIAHPIERALEIISDL
jgi:hypothetical protein